MIRSYQHRVVFIPLHVYNETIVPLLGPDLYIWGTYLAVEFYNFDDMGVNCAIHGPSEKVEQAVDAIITLNNIATSTTEFLFHMMMDTNQQLTL